jgi:hypothetical protein
MSSSRDKIISRAAFLSLGAAALIWGFEAIGKDRVIAKIQAFDDKKYAREEIINALCSKYKWSADDVIVKKMAPIYYPGNTETNLLGTSYSGRWAYKLEYKYNKLFAEITLGAKSSLYDSFQSIEISNSIRNLIRENGFPLQDDEYIVEVGDNENLKNDVIPSSYQCLINGIYVGNPLSADNGEPWSIKISILSNKIDTRRIYDFFSNFDLLTDTSCPVYVGYYIDTIFNLNIWSERKFYCLWRNNASWS